MKRPPRPGLWLVALREIRFFRRDRAGYLLAVVVPLIAFAVLTWTFSSAVVRGLDIVVVDADRSEVSTGSSRRSRRPRDCASPNGPRI